jgi:tRNA(His) 5'-end guanylyltransferase
MMKDEIGTRMKEYERIPSNVLIPRLPICVRLDGRAFHTFTRGLLKPYDENLHQLMILATKALVKETKAIIGYTQSDEISLILYSPEPESQQLFGGKVQKLCSVLASLATSCFVSNLREYLPSRASLTPTFDCRVWNVPNEVEASNVILWRWFDARRNSISALAQAHFSVKQLHGKDCNEMLSMLAEKNVIWEQLGSKQKWGTFVRRKVILKQLSDEELMRIPEKHRPRGPVHRTEIVEIDLPPFCNIANRVELLFLDENPVLKIEIED